MQTLPNVLTFNPGPWGEVEKFAQFFAQTYPDFKPDTRKAVSGVSAHFNKALVLLSLARKLAPNLVIDAAELQEQGFTPAANAGEFAAVVEAIFLELYSAIDCARKVIVAIYRKCRGIPDSTRKLFARLANGEVDNFPGTLRAAFLAAPWYDELRDIRDELTHASTGACHLSPSDAAISYIHQGLVRDKRPLVVPDVLGKIDQMVAGVNQFLGAVYHHLNADLNKEPAMAVCGLFQGRIYVRYLTIEDRIDLHSGVCDSRTWFDNEPDRRCPFATGCRAYARASGTV